MYKRYIMEFVDKVNIQLIYKDLRLGYIPANNTESLLKYAKDFDIIRGRYKDFDTYIYVKESNIDILSTKEISEILGYSCDVRSLSKFGFIRHNVMFLCNGFTIYNFICSEKYIELDDLKRLCNIKIKKFNNKLPYDLDNKNIKYNFTYIIKSELKKHLDRSNKPDRFYFIYQNFIKSYLKYVNNLNISIVDKLNMVKKHDIQYIHQNINSRGSGFNIVNYKDVHIYILKDLIGEDIDRYL